MTPDSIVQINWLSLVEKNAGFAMAFAILLIGGILGFYVVKAVTKQVTVLNDLIGNHMMSNVKAMKELTMSIREQRREASDSNSKMMDRHDMVLREIYNIKGKVGA